MQIKNQFSKKELLGVDPNIIAMDFPFIIYLLVTFISFSFIFVAKNRITPKFTIQNACPSNLGNQRLNPTGWKIMNLAFLVLGIGHTLVHLLYFNQMMLISIPMAIIILGSVILSNIGIIIAALVSEDNRFTIHFVGGSLYFGAAGIAGIIFIFFTLYRLINQQYWSSLFGGICFVSITAGFGIFLLFKLVTNKQPLETRFDLEWYLFYFLEIWQAGLFLSLSY